jgi:hypothetical protein
MTQQQKPRFGVSMFSLCALPKFSVEKARNVLDVYGFDGLHLIPLVGWLPMDVVRFQPTMGLSYEQVPVGDPALVEELCGSPDHVAKTLREYQDWLPHAVVCGREPDQALRMNGFDGPIERERYLTHPGGVVFDTQLVRPCRMTYPPPDVSPYRFLEDLLDRGQIRLIKFRPASTEECEDFLWNRWHYRPSMLIGEITARAMASGAPIILELPTMFLYNNGLEVLAKMRDKILSYL